MSVELDPAELSFRRPFDHEVAQSLRLHNPTDEPIAFKVKTTAPKQYCVRPNSGRIEPKETVEVQVLLQAMKEDPPLDVRCRDKFLVQSIAIIADKEFTNIQQVWQHIETTAKGSIQEKKIRVSFLPAQGDAATNGAHSMDDSFTHGSPTPAPSTPHRSVDTAPPPYNIKHEDDHSSIDHMHDTTTERSTIGAAVASVTNAIPTSMDELKAQLAEARNTISHLQTQAQDSILRQRKTAAVGKDAEDRLTTGMGVQRAPAGGVPVQIVAGLCLLCFLVAYLFF